MLPCIFFLLVLGGLLWEHVESRLSRHTCRDENMEGRRCIISFGECKGEKKKQRCKHSLAKRASCAYLSRRRYLMT